MARQTLSDAQIKRLKPGLKRAVIADPELAGHAIRVEPSGTKSFVCQARNPAGRQVWVTVGRCDHLTVAESREQARAIIARVRAGKSAREAPQPPADTFETVVERFIADHARPKQKTWRETARVLRKETVALWKDRPFREITREDVNAMLQGVYSRGAPYACNRTRAHVRVLYSWAIEAGLASANPCDHLRPKHTELARERTLTDAEISILWRIWGEMGWPWGNIMKLLLVTGARLSEVTGMQYEELDFSSRLWEIPRARMKSGRRHNVPLPDLAMKLIEGAPRLVGSRFVFPATSGQRHVSGAHHAKRRCDDMALAAGHVIPGWRLHDLRRTCRTNLSRLKVNDVVAELTIGHALQGLRATYDKWSFLDERREALDAWANLIERIVAPESLPVSRPD